MQQDPSVVVVNQPQGRVVGNRIIYNHSNSCLNCNFCVCQYTRGRVILGIITLMYFGFTVFGFVFGLELLGITTLCFFLVAVMICIWNYYRWKIQNRTQQAMVQTVIYNPAPPQQVPAGQYYQPYPQPYPFQNYPGQTQNYSAHPQPYTMPSTPSIQQPEVLAPSATEPPPPSYDEVVHVHETSL